MRVSVHKLALVTAPVNSANTLGTMRTVTPHISIRAKALNLALGCCRWDLIVVLILLIRHVLLHRSQHGHVEVLILSANVLHEVGARGRTQFHLVGHFVVRIASLRVLQLGQVVARHRVLASVDDDRATLRSLTLPVLMMEDSTAHRSLSN